MVYLVKNPSGAEFEVTAEHYKELCRKPEYTCRILGADDTGMSARVQAIKPTASPTDVSAAPVKAPATVSTKQVLEGVTVQTQTKTKTEAKPAPKPAPPKQKTQAKK